MNKEEIQLEKCSMCSTEYFLGDVIENLDCRTTETKDCFLILLRVIV